MSTIAFTGKTWTLWATLGFIFREPDRGSVTVVQSSTSLAGICFFFFLIKHLCVTKQRFLT